MVWRQYGTVFPLLVKKIQLLVFFSFLRMETDPMLAGHPTLQLSVADQEGHPWDYRSDIEVW